MSNVGRHYMLDNSLRVQTVSSSKPTGLSEDASRKHIATYSQPVQGPLEFSTYQAMAQDVHDNRALSGQKTPPQNTVGIFHENALPSPTVSGKRRELDVSSGVVMQSTKKTSPTFSPPTMQSGTTMSFAKNNNDHLEEIR